MEFLEQIVQIISITLSFIISFEPCQHVYKTITKKISSIE